MRNHTLRGILCTTIGGTLWGFSGTCIQYLFSQYELHSIWLTSLRLLSAGLLLVVLAFFRHREKMIAVWKQPRDLAALVLYGVFGMMMCQVCYTTSISYSNASTTTVLLNLSILFITVITCLQTRRLPNRREVLSLFLAVAGIWLLATGGDPKSIDLSSIRGLLWGTMAAVAVVIYSLVPKKRLFPCYGREVITGYGMVLGGGVLCLLTRSWQYQVQLPPFGWLAVLATIIPGTAIAFSLIMQGISDVGAMKASMLATTEPVAATILSALWLKTQFSAADLLGFVCILATIFLLSVEKPTHDVHEAPSPADSDAVAP